MSKQSFPPMPPEPMDEATKYFKAAMAYGFLSEDKDAKNSAHDYMFMGTNNGHVLFKHRDKRAYLSISKFLLQD